ncbi:MAG: DUF5011 domain-containing protein, partial [Acholeplasmataceae bacterium]|nr:DUF5011 domain-containing protein [Acholeplasmataceae bacterium]
MKKLIYFLLILAMIFSIAACQEEEQNPDVVPPNIVGTKNINYRIGDPAPNYLDGVSAYDNVDGNLYDFIIVNDDDVNLEQVGVYSLIYTVEDSSGNPATVSVSVTVLPGNTPVDTNIPVIIGFKHITHVYGDPTPDYLDGLVGFDTEDGYITENIIVDASDVNLEVLGQYDVTYSLEDNAKNYFEVSVELTVVDETNPVFSGVEDMVYEMRDPLPDFLAGVEAIDDYDGNITHLITVDSSAFDDWTLGTYDIIYTVKDSSDNETTYTRKIEVVDTTEPMISNYSDIKYIIGDNLPLYLEGVTAIDSVDEILTHALTFNDDLVNYEVPGTYEVSISVSDLSDNVATVIITVTVSDETSPLIIGAKHHSYTIGDVTPNLLEGVSATDNVDGDLTLDINITHNINYEIAGLYSITYIVTDSSNNTTFLSVTLTVISDEEQSVISQLNVFYINDTHGSITENDDEMGMAKIGNVIKSEQAANPAGTLFIGGGDLLQGSLLSNYFNGASMIEVLNALDMDAFVIGNHEFDWGIEVVTNYRDIENPLMYAEFPLLGANIFLKGTQTRPEYIDAYTIIQKGQVKVGVIGLIGYGLESSIATSRVSAYEFGNPLYWAEYYTEHLRTQEDVDMVLVVLHDDGRQSLNFNQNVSTWTGDRKVDAVFNGHSHQTYADMYVRAGADMPAIQSSANGKRLGEVSFDLAIDGTINQASAINLTASNDQRLQTAHPLIESIIESYVNQIEPLLNDVIIYAGEYINQSRLTYYMSELIRKSTDSDIGFHNLGGTRESISNGEGITIAKLYKIFPFDNRIKTVYLKGSTIEQYINTYGGYNSIREGIFDFEDNTYYKVATNDYIFDQVDNPFIYGVDIEDTGILIRDILETAMRNQAELGLTFMVDNPIILSASS